MGDNMIFIIFIVLLLSFIMFFSICSIIIAKKEDKFLEKSMYNKE